MCCNWLRVSVPARLTNGVTTARVCLQQRYTIDALISENHNLRSRVYRGRIRETGEVVAIKELGYAAGDHRSLQLAKLEVGVLFKVAKSLSTQFVISRLESFWDEAHFRFYVVLPWFRGETVYERIVSSRAGRLEERTARRIFAQMVTAVRELHRVGITHRDIKYVGGLNIAAHVEPGPHWSWHPQACQHVDGQPQVSARLTTQHRRPHFPLLRA